MIDYAYRAKTLTHSVNCYPLCVKIINVLDDSGTFSVIIIVPNIVWKVDHATRANESNSKQKK